MKAQAQDLRLSKAGVFVRCLLESAELLLRPGALAFFIPQLAVSGVLLACLANFHRAPLSEMFVPAVHALGGEDVAHYPRFFVELPRIFEAVAAPLVAFTLTIGWVAYLVATPRLFRGRGADPPSAWAHARRLTPRAWALTMPVAAVQSLAGVVILQLARGSVGESPRLLFLGEVAAFAIVVLIQVLSAYGLPVVALSGLSAPKAWARSWALATRNLGATCGFVLGPRLIELPFRGAIERLPSLWRTLDPEAVVALLGALVLVSVAATIVSLGALARFYLHRFGSAEAIP